MKTFLPIAGANPEEGVLASLQCLDDKRLGKQRVEAYQVWRIVSGQAQREGKPLNKIMWRRHPATIMWVRYAEALAYYLNVCCEVWGSRVSKSGVPFSNVLMAEHIKRFSLGLHQDGRKKHWTDIKWPWWWGNTKVHDSDKSALYNKDPKFYTVFKKFDKPYKGTYVWPHELAEEDLKKLTAEQLEEKKLQDEEVAILTYMEPKPEKPKKEKKEKKAKAKKTKKTKTEETDSESMEVAETDDGETVVTKKHIRTRRVRTKANPTGADSTDDTSLSVTSSPPSRRSKRLKVETVTMTETEEEENEGEEEGEIVEKKRKVKRVRVKKEVEQDNLGNVTTEEMVEEIAQSLMPSTEATPIKALKKEQLPLLAESLSTPLDSGRVSRSSARKRPVDRQLF